MSLQNRTIVALPAFNEEASLGKLLDAFQNLAKDRPELNLHIIVVNDGSSDRTLEVANSFKDLLSLEVVSHEKNMGLGNAIKTCLKEALARSSSDNDIIVTMDADNTHLPEYIPPLVEIIRSGCDIAIASRFQPGSREIGVPFIRRLYSMGARFLFGVFLRLPGVRDYTCGYRAFRASLIRKGWEFFQDDIISRNGFACTDELLVNLASLTDKISEIPFILRYDFKKGRSKLPLFATIVETWKLLLSHKPVGAYRHDHRLLIQKSREFIDQKRLVVAEETLDLAKNIDPDNPAIPLFQGILSYDSGKFTEAAGFFDACLVKKPANQLARNFRALSLYQSGKKVEAMKELSSQWLEHNSDFLCRFCALFEREFLKAPVDQPLPMPELAGASESGENPVSGNARRLFASAIKAMDKKDFNSAYILFNKVFRQNPDHVSALYGCALSLVELGNYKEAQRTLLEYFERKVGKPEPLLLVLLGRIYVFMGEFDTGIRILKTVPVEGPEDYCVHYNLGLGYLFQGDETAARSFFKKAFRHYFIDTWEDCIQPILDKIRLEI
ncbi:glycosyltransferase [Candidatus Sumerlaeota bacterium]|nr:glycosyltransferase [Candidatus Sumerlaeota bacterium]